MIIKAKDPIAPAITALEQLRGHPLLSADGKRDIDRELRYLRAGALEEDDAAFYLDERVRNHPARVILHDLRLECGDEVAQIDHLLINRRLEFHVLESKSFASGLRINDHGEFERWTGDHYIGMPSPVEQVERQMRILQQVVVKRALLPTRLGFTLSGQYFGHVIVSSKARVIRPKQPSVVADRVLKADAFFTRYEQDMESEGTLATLSAATRLVSKDTIIAIAQELVRLHRPHVPDYRARFAHCLRPRNDKPALATPEPQPQAPSVAPACPRCGKSMALRVAKRGDNIGKQFWGCSAFPACRGMLSAE